MVFSVRVPAEISFTIEAPSLAEAQELAERMRQSGALELSDGTEAEVGCFPLLDAPFQVEVES